MSSREESKQRLEVEQLFSSYGRSKIVGILVEYGELNITEIIRKTGLSHTSVSRHLSFLVSSGIVREKRFNRIRIFSIEQGSPVVNLLKRFFSEWNQVVSLTD